MSNGAQLAALDTATATLRSPNDTPHPLPDRQRRIHSTDLNDLSEATRWYASRDTQTRYFIERLFADLEPLANVAVAARPVNSELQAVLQDLRESASQPNWDGEDGKPVSEAVINAAMEIVTALPDGLPEPDIYPDPEGRIEFDWTLKNGTVFTLSVGSDRDVAMSGKLTGGGFLSGWSKNDDDDYELPAFLGFSLGWLKKMAVK